MKKYINVFIVICIIIFLIWSTGKNPLERGSNLFITSLLSLYFGGLAYFFTPNE